MGCVKTNSKKEGWNPFKKTAREKTKSKSSFQLTKAQKEEWCEYSEWINSNYKDGADRCVQNLETLGAGILFKPNLLKNHKSCVGIVGFTPTLDVYVKCLATRNDNDIYSIVKKLKNKKIDELTEIQANIVNYGSINKPEEKPDVFTHKGNSYTASKTCSDGKRFYWNVEKGFLKKEKVVEIGCLSDYELQSLKNQSSGGNSGAGRAASDSINNQTQRTINNMNQNYRNDFKNWQMKEFGY